MDLSFITDNLAQLIIGSGLIGVLGVYLVRQLLSNPNIDRLARDIDRYVDELQKNQPKVGGEVRGRLIYACNSLIRALKENE